MNSPKNTSSAAERFVLVGNDERRPGRTPMPEAFAVKATTDDTAGRLSLLEVTLVFDIPRHVHHSADEAIYVLDGELGVEFDGRDYTVGPGGFVLLPMGVPHALSRASTLPPRVLQISSPGGWERYLEDLFEAGPAVLTNGRLDPVKVNAIAARHDISYDEKSTP